MTAKNKSSAFPSTHSSKLSLAVCLSALLAFTLAFTPSAWADDSHNKKTTKISKNTKTTHIAKKTSGKHIKKPQASTPNPTPTFNPKAENKEAPNYNKPNVDSEEMEQQNRDMRDPLKNAINTDVTKRSHAGLLNKKPEMNALVASAVSASASQPDPKTPQILNAASAGPTEPTGLMNVATSVSASQGALDANKEKIDAISSLIRASGKGFDSFKAFGRSMGSDAADIVLSAVDLIGTPYKWGGESVENGFDCSSFIRHVYESTVGLVLPRTALEQAKSEALVNVKKEDMQPGDIVFFKTTPRAFSHVGLYVGDGKFVHAPRAGATIRVEAMDSKYWNKRFQGARRSKAQTT